MSFNAPITPEANSLPEPVFDPAQSPILTATLHGSPIQDLLSNEAVWRYDDAYARDPACVAEIEAHHVDGVHGTRSGSLLSILQHGLVPQAEQGKLAQPPLTGEFHTLRKPREGINVAQWLFAEDTAYYAEKIYERGDYNGISFIIIRNFFLPRMRYWSGSIRSFLSIHTTPKVNELPNGFTSGLVQLL